MAARLACSWGKESMMKMFILACVLGGALIGSDGTLAQEPGNPDDEAAFLQAYADQEGVIARPSGLLIKILERGDGLLPHKTSKVKVHYEGQLINGFVFDTSRRSGNTPAEFRVNNVIPGWTEALLLMQSGSIWEIVVPANMGYGQQGVGDGHIPPGATLKFRIELLDVL